MQNILKIMQFVLHTLLLTFIYIPENFAQSDVTKNLNKMSFEEFGVSKDSIPKTFNLPKAEQPGGTTQKELNKIQLEKFQHKQRIDSLKKDSLKNIINDIKSDSLNKTIIPKIDTIITKLNNQTDSLKNQTIHSKEEKEIKISIPKDTTPIKNTEIKNISNNIVEKVIKQDTIPKKMTSISIEEKKDTIINIDEIKITETKPIEKTENKKADTILTTKPISNSINISNIDTKKKEVIQQKLSKPESDFSTQPITKTTKETIKNEVNDVAIQNKNQLDSIKDKPLKEFYFETQPLINKNGKIVAGESAKQVEIKAPTEIKPNYTAEELAEQLKKEKYNQYLREADSIRFSNQKMLDSLLATLNVKVPVEVKPKDYIEIYVSGGGLTGGLNSKTYDRTIFYPNGVVQREYHSKLGGVVKYETKITKEELTQLAQFIVDLGFFDFEDEYECAKDDVACKYRMSENPSPIPLTITVAVGVRRKNIDIDFFAPRMEQNWVNYPKNLEKILNAIYSLAEQ